MKKCITVIISGLMMFFIGNSAFAECYVASNFKGYTAKSHDKFAMVEDGISGVDVKITIDGKKSKVSGSEELTFVEVNPLLVFGVYVNDFDENKSVIESYGVNLKNKKVFYTQTKTGYGVIDGVKMFIGDLKGVCK